jgi:Fe-S oxidoreductase
MAFLLRRAPYRQFLTDEWQDYMGRISRCTSCGECKKRCPYGLDTPKLLKKMLADYREFSRMHKE